MSARRRLAVALTVSAVLTGGTTGTSSAAWMSSSAGSGTASARQLVVATAPTATAAGSTVTVRWTPGANPPGTTHLVARGTGAPLTGCSATSCTETGVPAGTSTYTITPAVGLWRGPAVTATVTVAAAVAPLTVTDVSSTNANLTLEAGDVVTVTFSKPVSAVPTTTTVRLERPANGAATILAVPGVLEPTTLPTGDWLPQGGARAASFTATVTTSSSTVTVTIGALQAGSDARGIGAAGAITFSGATTLRDAGGAAPSGSFTTAGTFRMF